MKHSNTQTAMRRVQYTKKHIRSLGILNLELATSSKAGEQNRLDIKKDGSTVVWDSKGILDSWKSYCQRLYQDSRISKLNQPMPMVEVTGADEPNTLLDEIRETVNAIKKFKAPDCGAIEAELWQAVGE